MDIRRLTPDQHDAAVALWHAAGLTRPWNDPVADLERALAGPASTVLAASASGRLVGTVMLGHDGHRGWVYYLAVADDVRRQGIGSALVRACEQWLVERDIPKLQLMVRSDNAAAQAFYAPLGYDVVDVVVLGRRLDGVTRQAVSGPSPTSPLRAARSGLTGDRPNRTEGYVVGRLSDEPAPVSARPVVAVLALLVLALLVGAAVYVIGERGCPPPEWAFWRFSDGGNFACVAGR